jgi:hypothetical protein
MKFRYIGHCAAGFVEFVRGDDRVKMRTDQAVDVPEWLGKKLAGNAEFEAVSDEEFEGEAEQEEQRPARRSKRKQAETDA